MPSSVVVGRICFRLRQCSRIMEKASSSRSSSGKDGHIASLEKAACGRQLGHRKARLHHFVDDTLRIVIIYDGKQHFHIKNAPFQGKISAPA